MTFWEKLTKLCEAEGISPSKLCAEIGLSNATATHWKQGAIPTNATLKKICDYFKMTPNELNNHFYTIELFKTLDDQLLNGIQDDKLKREIAKQDMLRKAYLRADKNIQKAIDTLLGVNDEEAV